MGAEEKLKQIEEKLKKLSKLKKQIKEKLKKEEQKAVIYAKELAFCWAEHKNSENKFSNIIKCFKLSVCSRSKDKLRCVKRKLSLIVEHKNRFKAIHTLAELLLKELEGKKADV